ncbi:hypothetical protein CJF42_21230 [Pseudoalteromonas sp. NBT06-2]|uniref:heme biosynthesis HemY N-terminal domain-containing protein n=1 Tax=Pseudoalteromonas sp. NBT06-2 TaxID=2025950 RepID=UPI000BA6CE32|nr:heme biosynthesis HemY N-terminal domain-containing protein [Pseudoalteromonas sp. NBT06-2]PAJ72422.1 hypothetical protein CJF42_21230 [Pseudoalteromonas sp. NBT06-2]
MFRILFFLFIASITLALAPLVLDEKGYILISWNNTVIDGTLISFGILLSVSFAVLYCLYKLISYLWSLYGNTKFRFTSRNEKMKLDNLQQGMWASLSGDHITAAKLLAKSSVPHGWQGLSQATAAKAALAQGNKSQALDLLNNLDEQDQKYAAQLFIELEQVEVAQLLLAPVAKKKKSSSIELNLYSQLLIQQKKWHELGDLFPQLEKKKILNDEQWLNIFKSYFSEINIEEIKKRYNQLSRHLKILANNTYLKALLKLGETKDIEAELIKMLKKERYLALLDILAAAKNYQCNKLQNLVQQALKKQPEQAELLLCLAYIAKAQQDNTLAAKVFKAVFNQSETYKQAHWRAAVSCFNQQEDMPLALTLYQKYS